MKLKLAKSNVDGGSHTISQKEIEEQMKNKDSEIFYLDKDNSLKDIQKIKAALEKNSKSVYFNEIRYGLDKDSFLYELHVINSI